MSEDSAVPAESRAIAHPTCARENARIRFAGDGEMVRRVNEHDWAASRLGPIESWPESIRAAVDIALASTFQLVVMSGPDLVYIYNDASASIFGRKHPWALGRSAQEVWGEVWTTIGPMLHSVLETGRALRHDDLLLVLQRHGFDEECYFTFSYSPIRDADGTVTGVFVSVLETSERYVGERRQRTLGQLASTVASAHGEEVFAAMGEALAANPHDVPFAAIYLTGDQHTKAGATWLCGSPRCRLACESAPVGDAVTAAVAQAIRSGGIEVCDARDAAAAGACGCQWTDQGRFVALPLKVGGRHQPVGALMVGLNPRRALDDGYRSFLDMLSAQVATGIRNIEHQRRNELRLKGLERERALLRQVAEARGDFEDLLAGTSDAFLSLDNDLRILDANAVAARNLDMPRAELSGKLLGELPSSDKVVAACRSAIASRKVTDVECLQEATGQWLDVRCYPTRHGVIVFGNDISARKRAEGELLQAHAELESRVQERTSDLREANELLKAVLDRAPAAIALADPAGRIVRVNGAFQRMLGYSERKLYALSMERLVHPDDLPARRRLLGDLMSGRSANVSAQMRMVRSDGRVIWVDNFLGTVPGEDGKPRYIVRIVQDITDRRKAEEKIRASQKELRALYDRLQGVRREERTALAREVHDQLGQVLSAAKIDIKLLLDDVATSGPPSRRKLSSELRSASRTLDRAIATVRTIATELRAPEVEEQGLYSAITWHARDFERRTRIAVRLALPMTSGGPRGPAAVALLRIFQEALTNVMRHAMASTVCVGIQPRGACLLLRVQDDGTGLPPGAARAGTLGLVGMRERAGLAGGRVAVRGLRGGGTLVSALLPVPRFKS